MTTLELCRSIRRVKGGYIIEARSSIPGEFPEQVYTSFSDVVRTLWEATVGATAAQDRLVDEACNLLDGLDAPEVA